MKFSETGPNRRASLLGAEGQTGNRALPLGAVQVAYASAKAAPRFTNVVSKGLEREKPLAVAGVSQHSRSAVTCQKFFAN